MVKQPIKRVWDYFQLETGTSIPVDRFRESQKRKNALEQQTEDIAKILESGGIECRAGKVTMLGGVTGETKQVSQWRQLSILPTVARQKKAPLLRDLTYFLERKTSRFARYMVITNGQRIPASELKQAVKDMNRRISKWAYEVKQLYKMDVVFRGLEFPIDENGLIHLHANVVYIPKTKLSDFEFKQFLQITHSVMDAHLQDNGRLKNAHEVVKYALKNTELLNAKPELVCELALAVMGASLFAPMGSFRKFRQRLAKRHLRTLWYEGRLVIGKGRQQTEEQKRLIKESKEKTGAAKTNRLVSILQPIAYFTPFKEPVIIIQGDVQTVLETDESLRQTISEFRWWARDNGMPLASRYSVHNRSLSVPSLFKDLPDKPPPNKERIFKKAV